MLKLLNIKYFFLFITLAGMLTACSNYNRILKNGSVQEKYDLAKKYYNKKDYIKASPLFDDLLTYYRGTDSIEQIYYYYSYCKFGASEIDLASYHFKNLYETYPKGQFAEEAFYMYAYCEYLIAQPYYLDPSTTEKAISALQLFINVYPDSKRVEECNKLIDNLRERLKQKAYELSKLYFRIEHYKAAIVTMRNAMKDYPDLEQKEELEFLIVKAYYLYATNSIESKRKERFEETIEAYKDFLENNPNSPYKAEALIFYEKSKKELERYNK